MWRSSRPGSVLFGRPRLRPCPAAGTDAGGLLYRWLELPVTSDAEAGNRCHSDLPLSSAFTIPDDFRDPKSITAVTLLLPPDYIACSQYRSGNSTRNLMDRRRETRVDVLLPVRIWGVDNYCCPFMQLARVRNVSSAGAVIQGLRCQIKPGEIVDVQYEGSKAQFQVVWAGKLGTRNEGEIGIESLPEEPCIWDVNLHRCGQLVGNG